jgi:predicted GIY-YIG superfamily endonuclease
MTKYFAQRNVHPSQTRLPGQCHTSRHARAQNLLRLHHDEPLEDALHGHHRQSDQKSETTQAGNWLALHEKYKLDRLVHFERFEDVRNAIEREKKIKTWLRIKKIALIVSVNPTWQDLSQEWYEHHPFEPDAASQKPLSS